MATFHEGGCIARMGNESECLPVLTSEATVFLRQSSLNGLVLSVLSTTMQFNSQGILATLNLSKNRGF